MKSGSLLIIKYLAIILGVSALAMLFPIIVAIIFSEGSMIAAFAFPCGVTLFFVLIIFFAIQKKESGIKVSQGLLLACFSWILTCLLGAIPFYLARQTLFIASDQIVGFSDALFESTSGFSTTGATIFRNVEKLPRSIIVWRAMTQWLGGMGILVLTVALAPLIGTGGFQFFRSQTSGVDKGKFTLKITGTARTLWIIYVALTFTVVILFLIGGMNIIDALCHAFSTMSTGGFSTRSGGIGTYNSPFIEWVCIIFIFIAGFNFNLIHKLIQRKPKDIFKNSEARAYSGIFLLAAAICAFFLFTNLHGSDLSIFNALEKSIRTAMFQSVSILTTTGFSVSDHRVWHPLAQCVLFFLMFIGACSSSTGGGIKVIRHVILFKQARNELGKQLNPRGVFSIQINGREGQKDIVHGVAGFVFLYLVLVMAATLLISFTGVELFCSFNLGLLLTGNIGLGIVQGSMENIIYNLPAYSKWILSLIMIAGRLELWTIFTVFYSWRGFNIPPLRAFKKDIKPESNSL